MTTITHRHKAMWVLLAKLLGILDVVHLLGEVAAELTEARGAREGEVPLFTPI